MDDDGGGDDVAQLSATELDGRVQAARREMVTALRADPPAFGSVRRGAQRRRHGLVAAATLVAALTAAVLVNASPEGSGQSVVAGPAPSGSAADADNDLLTPGEARLMAPSPLEGRSTAASVWTGAEMLVWGGEGGGGFLDDGAGYDPRSDSWRMLPPGPLSARNAPAAVWTGTEMILWGGHSRGVAHADGASFDPVEGTWRSIAEAPIRSAGGPTAVWTGTEMVVVAGFNGTSAAAYDPDTDRWRTVASLPGQITGPDPQVVWTGTDVVAAISYPGGMRSGLFSYRPSDDRWVELPPVGNGQAPSLVWTGDRLLAVPVGVGTTAASYDPSTAEWTGVASWPPGVTPFEPTAVWTGEQVLLWNGGDEALLLHPGTGTWTTTPAGSISPRPNPAAVWADGVFLAWGGFTNSSDGSGAGLSDGVVLRPASPPSSGGPEGEVPLPPVTDPPPARVAVAGPDGPTGTIDRNAPPATWNGRTLPLHRVEDDDGNLVGYFGCRFFERSEVERDDFDAGAGCPVPTVVER